MVHLCQMVVRCEKYFSYKVSLVSCSPEAPLSWSIGIKWGFMSSSASATSSPSSSNLSSRWRDTMNSRIDLFLQYVWSHFLATWFVDPYLRRPKSIYFLVQVGAGCLKLVHRANQPCPKYASGSERKKCRLDLFKVGREAVRSALTPHCISRPVICKPSNLYTCYRVQELIYQHGFFEIRKNERDMDVREPFD